MYLQLKKQQFFFENLITSRQCYEYNKYSVIISRLFLTVLRQIYKFEKKKNRITFMCVIIPMFPEFFPSSLSPIIYETIAWKMKKKNDFLNAST